MILLNRIAELRKEKRLNQIGLAMKLNLSQKMISAYERGMHQPSIDTLIEMSKIFGVSVDYIIGNTDVRMPAENFLSSGLNPEEIELLDMFKGLDKEKQKKALGILFALKNYDGF